MKQTVHIVEELIEQINTDLNIKSVEDLGNNLYKLYVCNTQYLNTKFEFLIGGYKATVIEFVFNEYIIIEVIGFVPEAITYVLPKPFYNFGTVRAVNNERDEIPYTEGKYPYIFLLERMTEKFDNDDLSAIDRESPLNLFFLTNYDEGNGQTRKQYKEIIEPMSNLRENFITLLKNSKLVNDQLTFETKWQGTNYVRFGTYSENNGNIKSLMDEDVSGNSLDIEVVFVKLKICNNVCM